MTTIAYPMLVLFLTKSPLAAGLVGFAATVPGILLYVPAGAIVDRRDPRRVMLFSETGRGLAIATVVTGIAFGRSSVLLLASIAAIEESLGVFSTLAERSYACSLVDSAQMPTALVQSEARTHLVVLIGRPLGGFLFGLAHIVPFACDALSFLFSVGVIVKINWRNHFWRRRSPTAWSGLARGRPQADDSVIRVSLPRTSAGQLAGDIWAGLKLLFGDKFARTAVPLAATTTLIAQALIIMFFAEARASHLAPYVTGLVLAAAGMGGVFGSMTGRWLQNRPRFPWLRMQMWIWTIALLSVVLVGGGQSISMISAAMFASGFTGAVGNIALNAYLTSRGADGMLARLLGILTLIVTSASAIGSGVGGILAEWAGWGKGILVLLFLVTVLALVSTALSPESDGYRDVSRVLLDTVVGVILALVEFGRWSSRMPGQVLAAVDPRPRRDPVPADNTKVRPGEPWRRGQQADDAMESGSDHGGVRDRVLAAPASMRS